MTSQVYDPLRIYFVYINCLVGSRSGVGHGRHDRVGPTHSASAATAGVLCVVGRILGRVGAVSVDTIRALGAGIVGFATSRTFPRTGAISVLHVKVGRRVLGRFVFDFRVRIAERSDDLVPTCKKYNR